MPAPPRTRPTSPGWVLPLRDAVGVTYPRHDDRQRPQHPHQSQHWQAPATAHPRPASRLSTPRPTCATTPAPTRCSPSTQPATTNPNPEPDPRVGSQGSDVLTHHTVDPSQVGLTSMFAAPLRPLAQEMGWGLPNLGSVCSQLEVLETGFDLRVWRRQGSCSGT